MERPTGQENKRNVVDPEALAEIMKLLGRLHMYLIVEAMKSVPNLAARCSVSAFVGQQTRTTLLGRESRYGVYFASAISKLIFSSSFTVTAPPPAFTGLIP